VVLKLQEMAALITGNSALAQRVVSPGLATKGTLSTTSHAEQARVSQLAGCRLACKHMSTQGLESRTRVRKGIKYCVPLELEKHLPYTSREGARLFLCARLASEGHHRLGGKCHLRENSHHVVNVSEITDVLGKLAL